jgi:GTP-binding protein HflX
MHNLTKGPERALLVGVALKNSHPSLLETSLDELALLTESADSLVVGIIRQRLEKIVPSTFIGSGKVEQIAKLKDEIKADVVIIDAKLSGIQQRNLQSLTGCKVIDRHQLILDIFAMRARTHEGKLQVELAQLKDQLPRLIGEAVAGLSRLAGGIGTRGPGETKLEMDRRRIKNRIEQVTKELESVRHSRELHRKRRKGSHIPVLALTGYTNTGKSTLLNKLTHSDVYVENKLFATLDPTTRKLRLPSGKTVVMTDTVGFINNLPHHLVEAFKATFEEITEADIILHVHDASHVFEMDQSKTVSELLKEIGVVNKPVLHIYNKIDQAKTLGEQSSVRESPFVNISARDGIGLEKLLETIDHTLKTLTFVTDIYLPTSQPALIYDLAREGKIVSQEMGPNIIHCKVELDEEALQRWSRYLET